MLKFDGTNFQVQYCLRPLLNIMARRENIDDLAYLIIKEQHDKIENYLYHIKICKKLCKMINQIKYENLNAPEVLLTL